jgi:putative spermidine/putrescine transport system permease protein
VILSTGARWLLRLAAAAVLTFIYAPLVLVALNAFSTSVTFAWPPPGYTLRWWQAAASNEGVRTASSRRWRSRSRPRSSPSCWARSPSMALVRYDFFGRDAVSLLVLLPIALPGIVTGIALNTLFTQALGGLTFFTLVVGHATFCIVIVVNNASAGCGGCLRRPRRRRSTSAPHRGRRGGGSRSRPCAARCSAAGCWPSRCPSTRSS